MQSMILAEQLVARQGVGKPKDPAAEMHAQQLEQ